MTWTKGRPDADEKDDISVVVMDNHGKELIGLLVNLSPEGIEARFFTPDVPALTLGDELEIAFTSARLQATASAKVQIVQRDDQDDALDYIMQFVDAADVQAQLTKLKGIFNRRNAYRVQPTIDLFAKAAVEVERDRPPVKAYVRNISSTGIGLALPLHVEQDRPLPPEVRINLQLPGGDESMSIDARICVRRIDDNAAVYGMQFHRPSTPEFARIQEQIDKYVMAVQRGQLARVRGRA